MSHTAKNKNLSTTVEDQHWKMVENCKVSVGARVESEGCFGTVKFVGQVSGTKGE